MRQIALETLRCPKCHAANRPGAQLVELVTDVRGTVVLCAVCSHEAPYVKE